MHAHLWQYNVLGVVHACVLHVVLEELWGHAGGLQGAVAMKGRQQCVCINVPDAKQ